MMNVFLVAVTPESCLRKMVEVLTILLTTGHASEK